MLFLQQRWSGWLLNTGCNEYWFQNIYNNVFGIIRTRIPSPNIPLPDSIEALFTSGRINFDGNPDDSIWQSAIAH